MTGDAFRVDFRVSVYTSRGWIELERRVDGSTLLRYNGGAGIYAPLTVEELSALRRAIEFVESDPVLPP